MSESKKYDAVVVGGGPNGLAAAITIAQAGRSVALFEANETIGGGVRSAALTLPDFVHDSCSSVYPLAIGSPFFRSLPLDQYGLEWIQPPASLAHPFDDGSAVIVERSIDKTADALGPDKSAYQNLFEPLVQQWNGLDIDILSPPHWPRQPINYLRFGLKALQPARRFAETRFGTSQARALFAGLAAHAMIPLEFFASASFGLVLGVAAHAVGWPIVRGGAQKLADALAAHLQSLGGEIFLNRPVRTLKELPTARVVLCDLTPHQLSIIAGARLPDKFRNRLKRFRYGMGAFKIDWALSEPVPWKAPACARAATVHLGGTLEQICASERAAWRGFQTAAPFVLAVQPSLFDKSRAPAGNHTLWTYCHVPNGSELDMTDAIEAQIERFAPGFRDIILARDVASPRELTRRDANLIGGDINGGAPILKQLFFRPTSALYKTPAAGLYICSSSTPPGGGVHGMCGYFAARKALKECFNEQ
jgi:phytoene dehydrogenase-like protein